jgi:glycosyltransferase involved in cell wall biosynthesis
MVLELLHDNRSGHRLELVVPTFNEEKRIGNILCYYGDICDIVLLDDGSTDRTVEMAIEAGATVYRRTLKNIQAEYHFVYYINELSKSGMAFWFFADEFVSKDNLASPEIQLRDCNVVYVRRIEWVYGKRLNLPSGVMPRGFRKGYARFDPNIVHGAITVFNGAEVSNANNTFDIYHLSRYSMRDDFGKTGSYVFLEVQKFLSSKTSKNFGWKFLRRYVLAPLKMYLLQVIRSPKAGCAVFLHGALLNLVVLLLAILCWLEQTHFRSHEQIQDQYGRFFRTQEK